MRTGKPRQPYFAILAAALVLWTATGCVTYRNFPRDYVKSPPAKTAGTLTYKIVGSSAAGGVRELQEVMQKKSPCDSAERTEGPPSSGYYVEIRIKGMAPSIPAMVFGYLSVSTLTLTPFWSTQDGSDLFFEVFKDGERVKTFHYEVRRKGFVWLPMLPIAWVNFFTYSEEDAFRAIAYQFFADARSIFAG